MALQALSVQERSAILDKEISKYVRAGFRVVSRTETTAQLVKPKQFNFLIALLGLLFLVIGLFIYILAYMAQKDQTLYLEIGPDGQITRT